MVLFWFLFTCFLCLTLFFRISCISQPPVIACYFSGWGPSRIADGTSMIMEIKDIPIKNCTHVIHAFASIDETSFKIKIDEKLQKYKPLKKETDFKVLVAVGGKLFGSQTFSKMSALESTRRDFVNSTVTSLKSYGLDGINLCWIYPGYKNKKGTADDKENFISLLKELRSAFDENGLLLTAAVSLRQVIIDDGYNGCEMFNYLDQIHVMGYELRETTGDVVDVHSPLYPRKKEFQAHLAHDNIDEGMKRWLAMGSNGNRHKLILSLPFFGTAFFLKDSTSFSPGASNVRNQAPMFPFTQDAGAAAYYEICARLNNGTLREEFDNETKAAYAYGQDNGFSSDYDLIWVGYDNKKSLQIKMQYLMEHGFGGVSVWAIDYDDFKGICGEKYPLVKVIQDSLQGYNVSVPESKVWSNCSIEAQNTTPATPSEIIVSSTKYYIAASIALFVAVVIMTVALIWRRRMHSEKKRLVNCSKTLLLQQYFRHQAWMESYKSDGILGIFEDRKKLIPAEDLEVSDVIGSGNFGVVYSGHCTHKSNEGTIEVAIKSLCADDDIAPDIHQKEYDMFINEALTMIDFEHENVIRLIGLSFNDKCLPRVVTEFMPKGDLLSYIRNPSNNLNGIELLEFTVDVARGMEYLAKKRFVHRDLAARNCLLDNEIRVKIADFGLSRDIYQCDYYRPHDGSTAIPVKWMAPECITGDQQTEKSDVWSFGVLLWEVTSRGNTPYADVDNYDMLKYLKTGRRLEKQECCPDSIYRLMKKCWHLYPEQRPTFSQLRNILEQKVSRYSKSLLIPTSGYLKPITEQEVSMPPPGYVTIKH